MPIAIYLWNAAINRWTKCHAVFFKRVVTSQADFHAASPSEWQLACQREAVIRPLAEADRLSCLQVDRAAKFLV